MLHVASLCLVLMGTSIATDVDDRLTKVEILLENVLGRNARLEEENAALKHSLKFLEQRVQKLEEQDTNDKPSVGVEKMTSDAPQSPKRFVADFQASTVAFTALVSPPKITNLGAGQTIVYDLTVTNVGGAYKNGSGVFTAPISGAYGFNYALMVDPGFNEYVELVKNGYHVVWNYGHAPGASHLISASRTATVELMAGDQVWTRTQLSSTHGDGIIHGNGFSTFSGWLIAMYE